MKPVFLDTVGLLAIWDQDDQWHEPASLAFQTLKATRTPVVTTTFILAECGNNAARTAFRLDVDDLRQRLEMSGGLIYPEKDDWRMAWDGYRHAEAGQAGLVDQISFAVMRRFRLNQAFTNDRHFSAAGFVSLFG
jgi:uncharacterized protein